MTEDKEILLMVTEGQLGSEDSTGDTFTFYVDGTYAWTSQKSRNPLSLWRLDGGYFYCRHPMYYESETKEWGGWQKCDGPDDILLVQLLETELAVRAMLRGELEEAN